MKTINSQHLNIGYKLNSKGYVTMSKDMCLQILKSKKQPMMARDISKLADISTETVTHNLNGLFKDGLLDKKLALMKRDDNKKIWVCYYWSKKK